MSWRDVAVRVIWSTVEKARRDGVSEPRAILKLVNDAYPYGVREHYPYKVWLDEVRKLKQRLGLAQRKKVAGPGEAPGLFDA